MLRPVHVAVQMATVGTTVEVSALHGSLGEARKFSMLRFLPAVYRVIFRNGMLCCIQTNRVQL